MKKRRKWIYITVVLLLILGIAFWYLFMGSKISDISPKESSLGYVTEGIEEYRGFVIDNVFHSTDEGDIHYNVYIPESYDGSEPYALYFTLPGYEGIYFQGVAANIQSEKFGFEAQKYNSKMIIAASFVICFLCFATWIVQAFIQDTQTGTLGAAFLRIACLAVPLTAVNALIIYTLQAMGKGIQSAVLTICRQGLLNIPCLFLMNWLV